MFKRLSAGLLALTLLLGAAGCSSGKGSAAPTASRQSGSGIRRCVYQRGG